MPGLAVLLLWIRWVAGCVVCLWSASRRVVVRCRPRRRRLSRPQARQSGIASGVSIHWRFLGGASDGIGHARRRPAPGQSKVSRMDQGHGDFRGEVGGAGLPVLGACRTLGTLHGGAGRPLRGLSVVRKDGHAHRPHGSNLRALAVPMRSLRKRRPVLAGDGSRHGREPCGSGAKPRRSSTDSARGV